MMVWTIQINVLIEQPIKCSSTVLILAGFGNVFKNIIMLHSVLVSGIHSKIEQL